MSRLLIQRALAAVAVHRANDPLHTVMTADESAPTHSSRFRVGRVALIALASLACVACGHDDDDDDNTTSGGGGGTTTSSSSSGGSSSSSSGSGSSSSGSTPTDPSDSNSPFAGTYQGTVTLTASSDGVGSRTDTFAMTATVNNAGVLTFRSEQVQFTTTVSDNGRFSRAFQFDQTKDDTRCTGTLNISGRITSGSGVMDGNVSGPLTCERGPLNVTGTASGSFNARR